MLMRARQQIQYEHDLKHHFDIISLSRIDRIKHYGLHFAKYAGRLARGLAESKSKSETLVDAFLVSLSAANALNQSLPDIEMNVRALEAPSDLVFTDHAGRFADACEKIDHLEEFRLIAFGANASLAGWIQQSAFILGLDLDKHANQRRIQLARRAVYSADA